MTKLSSCGASSTRFSRKAEQQHCGTIIVSLAQVERGNELRNKMNGKIETVTLIRKKRKGKGLVKVYVDLGWTRCVYLCAVKCRM